MRVQNMLVESPANGRRKSLSGPIAAGLFRRALHSIAEGRNTATKDPLAALDLVIEQVEPAIFLFKDFHPS